MDDTPVFSTATLRTLDDVDRHLRSRLGHDQHLVTPVDRLGRAPYVNSRSLRTPLATVDIESRFRNATFEWAGVDHAYHILFPVCETGACTINGFRLRTGAGMWIGADVAVECFGGNDGIRLAQVTLPMDRFHLITGAAGVPSSWRRKAIPFTITERILSLLRDLFPSSTELPLSDGPVPEASEEFHELLRDLVASVSATGEDREPTHSISFAVAQEAYRLLRDDCEATIDIDQLSERLNTSRRTLEYGMRQHLGTSPGRLAKALRLRKVLERLSQTDTEERTIAGIARQYGFHHPGHFARDYADLFGELPNETLRRHRS